MKKCATRFCRNKSKHKVCSTCRSREWRQKNVERSSYLNLKHNSKRRGIKFEITFEQFTEFCYKHKYFQGKGKTKESASLDRKIPHLGYTVDNLQILSLAANTSKMHLDKRLYYDYENNYATVSDTNFKIEHGEEPF